MSNKCQLFKERTLEGVDAKYREILSGEAPDILDKNSISLSSNGDSFISNDFKYKLRVNDDVSKYNAHLTKLKEHAREYNEACSQIIRGDAESLGTAAKTLMSLGDYKNSKELLQQCKDKLDEIAKAKKEKEEAEAIEKRYVYAASLLQIEQNYGAAAEIFEELGTYKDSAELRDECLRLAKQPKTASTNAVSPQDSMLDVDSVKHREEHPKHSKKAKNTSRDTVSSPNADFGILLFLILSIIGIIGTIILMNKLFDEMIWIVISSILCSIGSVIVSAILAFPYMDDFSCGCFIKRHCAKLFSPIILFLGSIIIYHLLPIDCPIGLILLAIYGWLIIGGAISVFILFMIQES